MNGPASSHGAVLSEARRQRELLIRYSNSFRDITRLDFDTSAENGIPSDYVPRLSDDASLTAFAQLACLRLGANRAMISLIDGERQHILAEATPDVYLRAGSYGGSDASSSLWLGNVSIPRTSGICEQVLSLSPTVPYAPEDAVIIINDLLQNTAYAQRTYVYGKPHLRFYAGVALLSPKGAVVGALCVFDDKPRDGLLEEEVLHLRDLSATIMEYLESYSIKDQYRRGEKLTRALLSFNDGASAVSPFESEASVPDVPPSQAGRVPSVPSSHAQGRAARHGNVKTLQQSILPAQSRSMFARAASIICASSDLDGVLILDASVAGISDTRQGKVSNYRVSDDETTTSDGDTTSQKADSSPDEDEDPIFGGRPTRERSSVSGKQCHVLAFATPEDPNCDPSGPEDSLSFAEADLAKLFRTFPKGRIFNTTSDGELVSGADDSDASGSGSAAPNDTTRMQRVPTGGQERILKAIQSLAPEASSTAFVPLWDYERSRWFAGCLCWSKRPDRQLSRRLDLAYIKVFGHSIMTELSRLDALASDHAKTSFVASISHELRSPLHGILGTLEFLRDTPLDSFQASMLNSLDACGNTLLDTINHVLDYAKITGSQQHNVSSKRLKGSKGVRLSSKPLRKGKLDTGPPKEPAFDLAFVTEEVVEAVFSAQSYLVVTGETPDVTSESGRAYSTTSADSMSSNDGERRRRDRFVVLDIAKGKDWSHHLPVASWRRIVMNLFGNALKYTGAGHIHISLKSTPSEPGPESGQTVVLTMTDTGRGMSAQFLANRAFQPFSQENPLAAGTGLGLSIVRNIIETIGGKIDINSDLVSGTQVQVKLALPPLDRVNLQPQRTRFLEMVDRLKGRRVCILHRKNIADTTSPDMLRNREGLERFVVAMVGAMRDHLGMHVVQTETWESNDTDLVICPEPSFNYLASIRQKRSTATGAPAPVTIFVAMDPLEAATLRTDARVMNKASVVEIMTQPCGPHKLANILNHCLNRFESPEENVWSHNTVTVDPLQLQTLTLQHPMPIRPSSPASIRPRTAEADVPNPGNPSNSGGDKSGVAALASYVLSPRSTLAQSEHSELSKSADLIMKLATAHEISTPESKHTQPPGDSNGAADALPNSAPHRESASDSTPWQTGESPLPSRVLITDDNVINRRLLVAFARKYQIAYEEAENGLQALLTYQQAVEHRFDAIFMDISMPIMDGMSATRAIRDYERENRLPRTYVIALTGLASATARLEAWSSGVDYYATKPVNFKALQKIFNKASGKEGS